MKERGECHMDLNERKRKILQAIIEEYIGTAEPVGSRSISKKNELGLSSATIRNEMADLEEMGYLMQPHTSAGRIPSDIGYRFYVNSLMKRYQMSVEAMERMQLEFQKKVTQLENIIKKASMLTSAMTDYTAVVSTPEFHQSQIKKIDLVALGGETVMLIVITKDGIVKNRILSMAINDSVAARFAEILNRRLAGLTNDEINFDKIREIQDEIQSELNLHPRALVEILDFIYKTIESIDETEVYVDNVKSILKYPEYSDLGKAREMLSFLDNQKNLRSIIGKKDGDEHVSIRIGRENEFEQLYDCSLVTVNYSLGEKVIGKLGVIGPKRMNYAKVIAFLDCIASHIDKILYELYMEGE
ncbi:MAG: heat-inducible transcriptional repressor HrcA [Clostridia bacterium]|nr:heat-inducible transcriptional repressor HrcA [Clostridia bacterium]